MRCALLQCNMRIEHCCLAAYCCSTPPTAMLLDGSPCCTCVHRHCWCARLRAPMGMGSVIAHVYVFAHVYCSDACSARRSEKGWQDLQRPQGWPRELQPTPPSSIRGSRRSRPKGPHPVRLEARRKPSRRCAWCVVVKREKRKLSTGGLCLTNDLTDHTGNDRAQTRPD